MLLREGGQSVSLDLVSRIIFSVEETHSGREVNVQRLFVIFQIKVISSTSAMDVPPLFPKAAMEAPAPPLASDGAEQMRVFSGASSLSQSGKSFCTEQGRFICVLGRQMH